MTTMTPSHLFVRRVDVLSWVFAVVLSLAAWVTQPEPIFVGVLVGGLLSAVNFRVLASLVGRLTAQAGTNPSLAVAGLMGKLLGMAVAVFLALQLLNPDPVAVVVGLSVAPLSLLLVGAFARPAAIEPNSSEVPS